jgi:hypothetical protein
MSEETKTAALEIVDTTQGGGTQQRVRKQLTTANLLGRVTHDMIPEKGEPPKWVLNIYGQVEGYETGTSQFGDYVRLTGEFIATNNLTGEVTDGPTCILPGIAEMVIKNQFKAVGFGQPGGPRAIVFGMDIGIEWNKPDEQIIDGKTVMIRKHTWAVRPIGQKAKTPLAIVREQMEAARNQLELGNPPSLPQIEHEAKKVRATK